MNRIVTNCQRTFVLDAFSRGLRLDLRQLSEFHEIQLWASTVDPGCAVARLGRTLVTSRMRIELAEPIPSRPSEGILDVRVEVDPEWKRGTGHELERMLATAISKSAALDLESLCLVSGEIVFRLTVVLQILEIDGSLIDCCAAATLTALRHFKLPATESQDGIVTVHSPYKQLASPLQLNHLPILSTFLLVAGKIIAGPNRLEESVSESRIHVGVNTRGEVCLLKVVSPKPLTRGQLLSCISLAQERAELVTAAIKEADKHSWEDVLVPSRNYPDRSQLPAMESDEGEMERIEMVVSDSGDELNPPPPGLAASKLKSRPAMEVESWGVAKKPGSSSLADTEGAEAIREAFKEFRAQLQPNETKSKKQKRGKGNGVSQAANLH